MTERFISYAQNREDVLLYAALADVERGFYIDVGANDPDRHSVTRAFYERGWCGINVEPVVRWHEALKVARPRDVNLCLAAGAHDGTIEFFEVPETGLSTADPAIAERHRRSGRDVRLREVPVRRLASIWAEHAPRNVHFVKIDVEGAEAAVLAGMDLEQQRPWILVIESTAPLGTEQTHGRWEPMLTAARYAFAHFDGLNRYYIAEEAGGVAERLRSAVETPPPYIRAVERAVVEGEAPGGALDPTFMRLLAAGRPEPSFAQPESQLCTRTQFDEPAYVQWCHAFGETPTLHRKQWEFAYILQVLERYGMLQPGRRGLGFGCGNEPLAAVMAARGCHVVATDLPAEASAAAGWMESNQHARDLASLNDRAICAPALFAERVTFRPQDMNAIAADLRGFDFLWSSCALEHLGSIAHGLDFVRNAMACLKPGGVAVHTTEFNLTSDVETIEASNLVFFRRRDVERLARSLYARGHTVVPLNLNPGTTPLDRVVDLPPYRDEPHLRMQLMRFATTSLGLVVRRG